MSQGRNPILRNYGWAECERDLANGIHPEVAAARMGEPVDYILEVADQHGWPIRWAHIMPTADDVLDRFSSMHGLDS